MKTILITGASSGIGWDSVRCLDENNFQVVATVRSQADADKISKSFSKNVIPLIIDLTHLEDISDLPLKLKQKHQIEKLDGLVNNAGIALAGPFLDQDFSEIEQIIKLNVLSVMKLTQVLLPMLGAFKGSNHHGTIIQISSVAGKGGAPFLSAYSASKHAVEGFSTVLRKELMLFGINVVVIGPGSIKTPIWNKGFGQIRDRYKNSIYANSFRKFISIALGEEKNALEVSAISQLILRIFEQKNPSFRYAPIPRKWRNWYLPSILPKRLYNHLTAKTLGLLKKS